MKGCDKTVTIYHPRWDPERGCDTWIGQCLEGVSFHAHCLTSVDRDGLTAAMEAVMRVPSTAMLQGPDSSSELRIICNGDLVVLGRVPVNGFWNGVSPDKLRELVSGEAVEERRFNASGYGQFAPGGNDHKYSAARHLWTVVGITDNLDGRCPHTKVVLK